MIDLGEWMACANSIYTLLTKKLTQIVHWDLSNNKFTEEESKRIGQGLDGNTGIYGFHFEGNCGYINKDGFLIISNIGSSKNVLVRRINGIPHRNFILLVRVADGD
jgi:hypothetical protein